MSVKPEALRLAEELYAFHAAKKEMPSVGGQMLGLESYRIVTTREVFSQILDAADKLLRQHAEIERLKAERDEAVKAEREACAKVCDDLEAGLRVTAGDRWYFAKAAAAAIRARGQEDKT
jgi:predicted nucleotidyltransferase